MYHKTRSNRISCDARDTITRFPEATVLLKHQIPASCPHRFLAASGTRRGPENVRIRRRRAPVAWWTEQGYRNQGNGCGGSVGEGTRDERRESAPGSGQEACGTTSRDGSGSKNRARGGCHVRCYGSLRGGHAPGVRVHQRECRSRTALLAFAWSRREAWCCRRWFYPQLSVDVLCNGLLSRFQAFA